MITKIGNQNFYHYEMIVDVGANECPELVRIYFKTLKQIQNEYKISANSVYDLIKKRKLMIRKAPEIVSIQRVHIPVYDKIEKPRII